MSAAAMASTLARLARRSSARLRTAKAKARSRSSLSYARAAARAAAPSRTRRSSSICFCLNRFRYASPTPKNRSTRSCAMSLAVHVTACAKRRRTPATTRVGASPVAHRGLAVVAAASARSCFSSPSGDPHAIICFAPPSREFTFAPTLFAPPLDPDALCVCVGGARRRSAARRMSLPAAARSLLTAGCRRARLACAVSPVVMAHATDLLVRFPCSALSLHTSTSSAVHSTGGAAAVARRVT